MIEINLVPEHLRKKRKKNTPADADTRQISQKNMISWISGTINVLLCIHVPLQILIMFKTIQYQKHEQLKDAMATQGKNVNDIVTKLKELQEKVKSMQGIAGKREISWSEKLNEISDNLPRGAWLSRIALEKDVLIIQGSALLKDETKMSIHSFTSNLKGSAGFMEDFLDIEPGLIKRRDIVNTSVQDFTITANLK